LSSVGSFFSYVNDAQSHEPEGVDTVFTASQCPVLSLILYWYLMVRRLHRWQ